MAQQIIKSILSGIILTITCRCNLYCGNKYIGAVLFSLALLVIIDLQLSLYTGAVKSADGKNWKSLILILLGNFIGSQLFFLWKVDTSDLIATKLSYDIFDLLIKSIGCGILMAIATMIKKPHITIMCVATFILCGFEHSIANMCYFAGNYTLEILKFIVINILGNSIGAISFYRLFNWSEKINENN